MIKTSWLEIESQGRDQVINISNQVANVVVDSKIEQGLVTIFVHGSTASVTTVEYEPGLVNDIKTLGERLAPSDQSYAHDETWHDGNGHSHIRASTIGPSLTVPLENGTMTLGTWQQIVVIDHDNKSRNRQVVIQVMGDS